MNNIPCLETLLEILTHENSARFLILDRKGIVCAFFPQWLEEFWANSINHSLNFVVQHLIPGSETLVWRAFEQVLASNKVEKLLKLQRKNRHGLTEYFNWTFYPKDEVIIALISDVTDQVMIEEEFTTVTEQYEQINRELYAAMSKQDFYLMDLEQTKKQISVMHRISSIVQKTVNQEEILSEILKEIGSSLGYVNLSILLIDEESQQLCVKAFHGYSDDIFLNFRISLGQGITGAAAANQTMIYVPNVLEDERYIPSGTDTATEVAIPLISGGNLLGVFNIEAGEERRFGNHDLELFQSLANQIAMTIIHARHVKTIQTQAITDGMTGLYNYRYFCTLLQQEIRRAKRYHRPLALLMIDIDFFKVYNDTHGHQAGDAVLKQVAQLIKNSVRDVDHVIRYGGEEFVVLLPETALSDALVIAERIRKTVAAYPFPNREFQPNRLVSLSLGIAEYPKDAVTDVELIEQADTALYDAKKSGRNCVKLASPIIAHLL